MKISDPVDELLVLLLELELEVLFVWELLAELELELALLLEHVCDLSSSNEVLWNPTSISFSNSLILFLVL